MRVCVCSVAAACAWVGAFATACLAQEDPKDIIADQVRRQGIACVKVLKAERDATRSKADSEVWTISCETATYRVRLVADQAAHIERLD